MESVPVVLHFSAEPVQHSLILYTCTSTMNAENVQRQEARLRFYIIVLTERALELTRRLEYYTFVGASAHKQLCATYFEYQAICAAVTRLTSDADEYHKLYEVMREQAARTHFREMRMEYTDSSPCSPPRGSPRSLPLALLRTQRYPPPPLSLPNSPPSSSSKQIRTPRVRFEDKGHDSDATVSDAGE